MNVNGSISATPVVAVRPGMAPTPTPTKTPIASHIIVLNVKTSEIASESASKLIMGSHSESDDAARQFNTYEPEEGEDDHRRD